MINPEFCFDALPPCRNLAAMTDQRNGASSPSVTATSGPTVAWFCLRSQPKHEHIAARHLQQMEDVQVFNPRVRFKRRTRHGEVVVTEAMFPNYLFARFDWKNCLNKVHYAPGVSGVVHFGDKWPTIPDSMIEEMRSSLGDEGVHLLEDEPKVGEEVELADPAWIGWQAVITRYMPGSKRVIVLMHLLGRQNSVEVGIQSIIRKAARR